MENTNELMPVNSEAYINRLYNVLLHSPAKGDPKEDYHYKFSFSRYRCDGVKLVDGEIYVHIMYSDESDLWKATGVKVGPEPAPIKDGGAPDTPFWCMEHRKIWISQCKNWQSLDRHLNHYLSRLSYSSRLAPYGGYPGYPYTVVHKSNDTSYTAYLLQAQYLDCAPEFATDYPMPKGYHKYNAK